MRDHRKLECLDIIITTYLHSVIESNFTDFSQNTEQQVLTFGEEFGRPLSCYKSHSDILHSAVSFLNWDGHFLLLTDQTEGDRIRT